MAEKSEILVTKEDRVNDAKELFGRGSRNFCMKQFSEAADDLSACCGIYSELYGPQAKELGLPYLLYAKSLIALGKDENNLIVPGEDEEEIDENDEEGEEGEEEDDEGDEKEPAEDGANEDDNETMDTSETAKKTQEKDTPKKEECTVVEKKTGKADKTENGEAEKVVAVAPTAVAASSSKDAKDEPQPGPSTSSGITIAQEDTEDTAGNLQVAWEILELAVKIFQSQGDEANENLSECYTELAGISFENSHFQEAIHDYNKGLEISKKINKSDLRMLAEVHYKVGLCSLMMNDFDASVKSFKNAIGELEKVIEGERAKEQTDETKEKIDELEETKNDILEKIADVEEAKKTSIEEVKRELSKIIVSGAGESSSGVNNGAGPSSSSSSAAASTNGSGSKPPIAPAKPANDISHLIKRKKPDSSTAEVEGSPAKKTATES